MKKLIAFILVLIASQSIFAQGGWQSTFENNPNIISKLIPRGDSSFFAFCYTSKYFLKSTDKGINWTTRLGFDSAYSIYNGQFVNASTGWITGTNNTNSSGLILKTTDGGESWVKQNIGNSFYFFSGVCFINPNTGWICSSKRGNSQSIGCLLKTSDGGLTWNYFDFPSTFSLGKVKFFNEQNGLLMGYNFFKRTTNGGVNWDSIPINNILPFINISYVNFSATSMSEYWFLVAGNNYNNSTTMFMKTSNGGNNWNLMLSHQDFLNTNSRHFYNLDFKDSQTGYASGPFNFIYRTIDGGFNWDSLSVNATMNINSLSILDQGEILAGGGASGYSLDPLYNKIIKSNDNGVSWSIKSYNGYYNFFDVHFKDSQNGIAVADTGNIFRTTNSGISWIQILKNSSIRITSFASANGNTLCGTSSNGKIFFTTNYGYNWELAQYPQNNPVYKIHFINNNVGFAICTGGVLLKSIDSGLNWYNINSPASDYNSFDANFINENTGWILSGKVVIPHPSFHTTYTKIVKTTNGGDNWFTLYDVSTGSSWDPFYNIKFLNENIGFISNFSVALKTINGGLSWEKYIPDNDKNCSTLKMINENTGWCAARGQNFIFKTTNAGINWTSRDYAYGPSINSIFVLDSNNLWYCGNMSSIYKSTTGGSVFVAQISNEIPDKILLHQNYPNPFNPSTRINYELRNLSYVTLKVFDLLGKEVATLVNEKQYAGSYAVDFNSSEFNLPSGIYFYTLNAGEFKETKKMVLVK